MLSQDEARKACETIFAAAPTDEVEVILTSTRSDSLRIAEGGPSEQNALDEVRVMIRVVRDGRQGRAAAASLEPEALRAAVRRADETAALCPPQDLPELPGPGGGEDGGHGAEVAAALAAHPQEKKVAEVADYLKSARAEGLAVTGFYQTAGSSFTYATGKGRFRHGYIGKAGFTTTVIADPGGAGAAGAVAYGRALAPDEVAEAGRRAAAKALDSREPRPLEPGAYDVVLEPKAAGDLAMFLAWAGFGARAFLDGRSFLTGRIGEKVLSERLSFVDDKRDPRYGLPLFDCEGQDTETVELVKAGVAKGPVWDRPTAREGGCRSTGHAGPQPSAQGPLPSALVVRPEGPTEDDLVAGVERGLLVTQFHYTNLIDPLSVTVTGMTRNGTFLIENGRIRGPVRNLRFTQSLVEAFSNVTAVGADQRLVEPFFGGAVVTPSLRIAGFRFTSATEF